jgi:hypothetical protein
MTNFTALYDSCVLYPAPLRDLLMWLALSDLFRARWSNDIHEEWIRNLLEDRPDLTREQLERTRDKMNSHVRDCLVTGYEPLIDGLTLPDPNDRHVLAAAIRASADVIVTFNLKDFPTESLAQFGVEAQHPDTFIVHLIDLNPGRALNFVTRCWRNLKNPPKTVEEYLDTLLIQGLPETVAVLQDLGFGMES